jgi:undecaprenyl-phosphate 4-deoxy-4-formamido-L-arabinose transferase
MANRESMPPLRPGISVVIPVYNSEKSLPLLVERLLPVLRGCATAGGGFELILVNDGSRDESWRTVGELSRNHAWVHGIDMMRNYGQHNALLCGLRSCRFETTITMDDDLQHPPEEIPKLLAHLEAHRDVVYGTPEELPHGLLRNLASSVTKFVLQSTMGAATARRVSAFRAFRTELRTAFEQFSGPFVSIDVLLTWGTTRFSAVVVRHEPRAYGKSNYTLSMLLRHAFNLLTGFSTVPLQIASYVGFAATLFGLGVLVYVLGRYFIEGGSVPGFPFLASTVAVFSGATLFALGIMGEYLARMHFRLMDRPAYVVRRSAEPPGGTA